LDGRAEAKLLFDSGAGVVHETPDFASGDVAVVKEALQAAGSHWAKDHWQLWGVPGGARALGLGSNMKKRFRAGKLALAVTGELPGRVDGSLAIRELARRSQQLLRAASGPKRPPGAPPAKRRRI